MITVCFCVLYHLSDFYNILYSCCFQQGDDDDDDTPLKVVEVGTNKKINQSINYTISLYY